MKKKNVEFDVHAKFACPVLYRVDLRGGPLKLGRAGAMLPLR